MHASARKVRHAGQTESRGTDANPPSDERVELAARLIDHPELGVEHREPGAPHRLIVVPRRQDTHQGEHLGETTLFATDREHLQAIHARVENNVAGSADGVSVFGRLLGFGEPPRGERQYGLVHQAHVLIHEESTAL